MSGQDVLVCVETHCGVVSDGSVDAVAAARHLVSLAGGQVQAVVLSDNPDVSVGRLTGADRVEVIHDPALAGYAPESILAVLQHVVSSMQPLAVVFGSTSAGLDVGPLLATKLDVPVVNACQDLAYDGQRLQVKSSIYGGKLLVETSIDVNPAVLMILPGAFRAPETFGELDVVVSESPIPLEQPAVRFEEMLLPDSGDVDITKQDVLVAVGRGIQQEDNLEVAEQLAEVLGGAVAASRPIVDQGWLPPTRQVGKSGMKVKPKCYIALGISGAPEHVEGMKDSGLIIAVNTDANAPIFEVAHFGIVSDVCDVAELLIETLEQSASV